jgi:hypothetical protein
METMTSACIQTKPTAGSRALALPALTGVLPRAI